MAVPEDDRSPQERERAAQAREHQATLTEVLAKAGEHFRQQLKQSRRAIDYLKRRGLTGEIAARFGMGYAPEGWRGLASVFPRYDDPLLEESGLVIAQPGEGENDAKRYDRFRDRIMFPIRSVQGEVIGFGGRVLDQGEPKYLNSPETPVFVKGRELYGLYEARTAMRQKGYVLVVEGYMDVVALAQLGFPNAVATLGTACTAEHVQKLFRFTDSVVFSFDGDAAGRRAAGRALEAALPHATDVRTIRFLFLPPEHDPDSYVREHGPEAFEQHVAGAVPLSRQLLEAAGEGCALDTAEGRSRMLANAKPLWSALPDDALKRQIAVELASRSGMETADLLALWGVAAARASSHTVEWQRARRSPRRVSPGTAKQLDRALWLLVQRSDLWGTLDGEAHDLLAGRPSPYDAFFGCLERSFLDHGPLGRETLLAELRQLAEQLKALPILARVAQLHDPEGDTDLGRELATVLDWLRLDDLNEDLQMIVESGELSPEMLGRFRELDAKRAHLKGSLAKT
jgi:DNA primase